MTNDELIILKEALKDSKVFGEAFTKFDLVEETLEELEISEKENRILRQENEEYANTTDRLSLLENEIENFIKIVSNLRI